MVKEKLHLIKNITAKINYINNNSLILIQN